MNNLIQDWMFDSETNHKKSLLSPPEDNNDELVELLWQNGQLVLQTQQKQARSLRHLQSVMIHQVPLINSIANSQSNLTQEQDNDDQTVSWVHDPNFLDNSHDFISQNMQPDNNNNNNKTFPNSVVDSSLPLPKFTTNPMPPPIFPDHKGCLNLRQGREAMVGSSHCGSNQLVTTDFDLSHANCGSSNAVDHTWAAAGPSLNELPSQSQRMSHGFKTETVLDPNMLTVTVTSSSGVSGSTCKKSTHIGFHKRKNRDESQSDDDDDDHAADQQEPSKPGQRSGSARRSRAAQVHNLSERRRRDRINEKMRALQELIPHSNKADKASMLDEAIEYLKSLQFQLQLMWMGSSGMAPMMFQGMHRYMSCMGMGVGPTLPHINNPMQLQSMAVPPPQNQPVNYQNQMQSAHFSNQYARYMGFQSMQQSSQPGNIFGFGSQNSQLPMDNSRTFNVEGAGATCNALASTEKTG